MPTRGGRGGCGLLVIIVVIALVFFTCRGGGNLLGMLDSDLLTGGGSQSFGGSQNTGGSSFGDALLGALENGGSSVSSGSQGGSFYTPSASGSSSGWYNGESNNGVLNTNVSSRAREKRTVIKGDGTDKVTVMVYLCGTDLESKSGMATRDLQEMLAARFDTDRVNVLIYTGGCLQWRNNIVSNSKNQIYRIAMDGSQRGKAAMFTEQADMGSGSMVSPDTLSSFIRYCAEHYPANRYELIFWDHGGGSQSGYGYDEKNPKAGSMTLSGINRALKDGGVTFDMIGFDTCLMATVENALVASQYGDYLVASEETEPGVGWYYTDWLSALASDPGMDTLSLGRMIVDSFADTCARSCPGQPATLSVTDLAELEKTVPETIAAFSKETSSLITNDSYRSVSDARAQAREFAPSTRIDQIDLVHLARNLNTESSNAMADALLSAVKYNRASQSMANSYGLSAFFPYKNVRGVDGMVREYREIGMDEDYTRCIQQFASLGVSGQAAAGGSYSDFSELYSLFGGSYGSGAGADSLMNVTSSSFGGGEDALYSLLSDFLGSDFSMISGLDRSNTQFLQEGLDPAAAAAYLAKNMLDPSHLCWQQGADGTQVLALTDADWDLISDMELSVYFDDGQGWLDLGLDTIFNYDDDGNLLAPADHSWLALNGQIAAYYHISTTGTEEDYTIIGRIPVLLNGDYANLLVVFDTAHEEGYVAGVTYDYRAGETATVPKSLTGLEDGDLIELICDGYDYSGNYQDTFKIGDPITVEGGLESFTLTNEDLGSGEALAMFRIVDCYGQEYWTEAVSE